MMGRLVNKCRLRKILQIYQRVFIGSGEPGEPHIIIFQHFMQAGVLSLVPEELFIVYATIF